MKRLLLLLLTLGLLGANSALADRPKLQTIGLVSLDPGPKVPSPDTTSTGLTTDAPYTPVPESLYTIKAYPPTDIPQRVNDALDHIVNAEYELGSSIDDAIFLGEVPGLYVYGYKPDQYEKARQFIAETDFTRQGIMAVGTSSIVRTDKKLDPENERRRIISLFNNVLLGPARSGAINGQLDYRLRPIVTPIVAFRQGTLFARVNRPINTPPDTTRLKAMFAMWDEKVSFRAMAGGAYRHAGNGDYRTPVVGVVGTKAYRQTQYEFTFNQKDKTINIANVDEIVNCPVGGYAYMGESIQPSSDGIYATGIQVGTDGTFFRLGLIMMNRFDRGTRIPDQQAYGPTLGMGYCFTGKSRWSLDVSGEFGAFYSASNNDLKGDWVGSPGATLTLNYDF